MTQNMRNNISKHITTLLLSLLMQLLGGIDAWGQTDYSGTYYIGSVGYNANNTTTNYYLCPTEGWAFFVSDDTNPGTVIGTDNGKPFLTTYQCRSAAYHSGNSGDAVWYIEQAPNSNYYYIKHANSGRYMVSNGAISSNPDRARVHLETVSNPKDLGDKVLFDIYLYNNSHIVIKPIGIKDDTNPHANHVNHKWLTINQGNKDNLAGTNARTDGPTGFANTGGIVCLYTENDGNGKFYLEPAAVAKPTITNNYTSENTFTISAAEGATIYYTTDGTTPTTATTATGTTSVNVDQTENMTVIKAIAKAASDAFPSVVTTYTIPQCARPVITVSSGNVTITCATAGATIYYTTNGDPATTSSTPFDAPFAKGDATTIRAIAKSPGYLISNEAILLPPTEVSSSSEITDMNGNYILASTFSSSSSIGTSDNPFTGTIDGGLNTLTLSNPLVAYADGATIKNVILKDVSLSSGTNVGAICNEATGETRIYNCGVLSGSVGGSDKVGGIVGLLDGSSRVINCFNYADITSGSDCGGIVGYNNVASTSGNLKTMVMNCMFYGNITGGNAAPIYGGAIIHNKYASADNTGLNNYCYFLYDEDKNPYVKTIADDKYHGALGAEERYLNRFEFFRLTLNSTRNLAAYYVTDDATKKEEMAKWVLDKSVAPYPILKVSGCYPSIVNPDAEHATDIDANNEHRNEGRKLGTLTVTINNIGSGAEFGAPSGAHLIDENGNEVQSRSLTLNITDKDFANYNFNYKKVQLPYYSEVGVGNYSGDRVVTGWKITGFTNGTAGTFTGTGSEVTFDEDGNISTTPFNFVDRKCTNKDYYGTNGSNRVFNQGAYWEVPDGVTGITIEPYWAKAVYLSDAYYDVTYSGTTKYGVTVGGTCPTILGTQTVNTDMTTAINSLAPAEGKTVYDYAVVLVGNYHHYTKNAPANNKKPMTIMSADLDGDHEPDNTLFYYHDSRKNVSPIRFDFLNMPGIGMMKRTYDATDNPEPGIFKPNGWFEITNTVFVRFGQFEYAEIEAGSGYTAKLIEAPVILQGGIYEQFVSTRAKKSGLTNYLLVGGNAWFKNFANGCHTGNFSQTPKVPINVTGGDYENFYLTGIYQPNGNPDDEDVECYIDGGRFKEVAGAGMQRVDGNVTWLINAADITSFFGGGINDAQSITGHITTKISNSYVDEFYGGPKFGSMASEKKIKTTATDCHFNKFFGAGYGGTSLNRVGCEDATIKATATPSWSTYFNHYTRKYETTHHSNSGGGSNVTVNAISTSYDYEYIIHSDGSQTVARFFVNFASLSLASTHDVISNLTGCTIGDFYGGGSLGAVYGNVNSTLTDCTVTGDAFGAGYSASVPTVEVWNTGAYLDPNPTYNRTANVFNNTSVKTPKDNGEYVVYTWSNSGSNSSPFVDTEGQHYIHTDQSLDNLGTVSGNVTLNILGSNTHIYGDVYGGGAQSKSNTNYYKAADPVLTTKTTINLLAGTIDGDVYGGGQGRLAKDAVGTPGSAGYEPAIEAVAADAGSTKVNLNGMEAADYNGATFADLDLEHAADTDPYTVKDSNKGCIVKGSIFGCNNLNGTPKGDVTVNIYKTEGYEGYIKTGANAENATAREAALDDIDDSHHSYEVKAVYGGGNLAAYEPNDVNNKHTQVNIYGCGSTSIQQVYGGGNAASTPATQVDVYGTYEIEEVFGGGNGKDDISHDGGTTMIKNPGANVGFKDYWDYEKEEDMEAFNTKEKRDKDKNPEFAPYIYGSGEAHVNIHGGRIHRVYGGSNTKGNVKTVAVTMLEETGGCDFKVDEAYGGGKSAEMDGASRLEMACIPGLKNAYGGAEAANIESDVTLTITNGNFDRVFGGNNVSGTINGTITVNIEETGCHLITISQLYGGGNQAAYTGPEILDNNNEPTGKRQGPTLNVRSFTSIGEVYGGGYGKTATVTGDTYVNINVCDGKNFDDSQNTEVERANNYTGNQTISFSEFRRTDDGGFETDNAGNRIVDHQKVPVYLPPFTSGEIGAINNVYGGGNAAKVIGDTFVNIGTKDGNLVFATPSNDSEAERTHQIKGATITGNVYGGGNNAEVTGNTNVTIGKKETTN